MNYLAHLYFAGENPESIVGNFLGDFVKGNIIASSFSEEIQAGIALHRSIDRKADDYIIQLLNQNIVSFKQRRYAGITFDLACDHFLAKHWADFYKENISSFARQRINTLKAQEHLLPEKGKQVLSRMTQYQWLENNQDLDFLEQIFKGIHKRFPRENQIDLGFMDVKDNYLSLEERCLIFIKQLQNELFKDN